MSAKKQKDNDFLDALLKEQSPVVTLESTSIVNYAISAAIVGIAPAWLFYSMFQLNGVEAFPLFGVITIVLAIILVLSYHNTTKRLFGRILGQRPEARYSSFGSSEKQSAEKTRAESVRANTKSETIAFSILYNNLLFVGLFVFFGFMIFGRLLPGLYNYPVSTLTAGGLVFLASRTS